jgi:hypothetical protein
VFVGSDLVTGIYFQNTKVWPETVPLRSTFLIDTYSNVNFPVLGYVSDAEFNNRIIVGATATLDRFQQDVTIISGSVTGQYQIKTSAFGTNWFGMPGGFTWQTMLETFKDDGRCIGVQTQGFRGGFVENYVDEDAVESYIRDFFNYDVYENPDVYLGDDDKEISSSQKQEIAKLRQEEIELDSERDNLDPDEYPEDYIEQRTTEIEERLLEIQDEIEEINNSPDGDYDEDAIEKAIDNQVYEHSRDLESFVSNFIGTDYFEWIINNNFINKEEFIQGVVDADGYGTCLNSYDGDANEEVVNDRTYYIVRVS